MIEPRGRHVAGRRRVPTLGQRPIPSTEVMEWYRRQLNGVSQNLSYTLPEIERRRSLPKLRETHQSLLSIVAQVGEIDDQMGIYVQPHPNLDGVLAAAIRRVEGLIQLLSPS